MKEIENTIMNLPLSIVVNLQKDHVPHKQTELWILLTTRTDMCTSMARQHMSAHDRHDTHCAMEHSMVSVQIRSDPTNTLY